MFVALFLLLFAVALMLVGCQATRAGYESAPYQVVRTDGKFEVREYPALTVVETPMNRHGNEADGSFNRLFGFITGRNEAKKKLSMTTPVFISGSDSNRTMAFVMPARMNVAQAPKPADGALTVRELPAGRFAVLRFSGTRNEKMETDALGRLQTWMAAAGLQWLPPPVYGYYDPPWTPAFLRRNEVILRTESSP